MRGETSANWDATAEAIAERLQRSAGGGLHPLRAQTRLLTLLGSRAPLGGLLHALASYVETWADGLICSILLVDGAAGVLRHGAAPSLPVEYTRAVDGVPIGEGRGTCGTAAHRRDLVVVHDIATSPLWVDYRALARAHGLAACWSMPVFDDEGAILATLALYHREPRTPTAYELDLIRFAAALAAFAIQRHRDLERLRDSEEGYRCLAESCPDPVLIHSGGRLLYLNATARRVCGLDAAVDPRSLRFADLLEMGDGADPAGVTTGLRTGRLRCADGTTVPVEISAGSSTAPGHDSWVLICRDLRARLRLERAVIDAADRERARIASELHDGLCQQLAGIALLVAASRDRDDSGDGAVSLRELITRAVTEARVLAGVLSPLVVSRAGFHGALQTLHRNLLMRHGADVEIRCAPAAASRIAPEVAEHLFRIAEEAALNAVRHARAARIVVAVADGDGGIELRIEDDGIGIAPGVASGPGTGLQAMRYRAGRIGARLSVDRVEPRGTRVVVHWPVAGDGPS